MTVAARYWRVFIRNPDTNNARSFALSTLKLFNAAGVDVTGTATVTATDLWNATSYPLANAADSNNTSFTVWFKWTASEGFTVTYDFGVGNAVLVDRFLFRVDESDVGTGYSRTAASSFVVVIRSSLDNVTWVQQSAWDRPFAAANVDYYLAAHPLSIYFPRPNRAALTGTGGIYGIVSEDGVALPNRPVYLVDRATAEPMGYATTDENGGYAFNGLNELNEYTVYSVDPSGPPYKNALIWDRITPINTKGAQVPSSRFWARRVRDRDLGGVVAITDFLQGPVYRYFKSGVLGQEQTVEVTQHYQNYTFLPTEVAGGAIRLIKSARTTLDRQYGLAFYTGTGAFGGVNAAAQPDNYSALTFEFVFAPPSGTESDLIMVWGGTRDSDDYNFAYDSVQYSQPTWASGPTLQVTSSVMNVRFPLGGRNRATVRASVPVVQGQVYHVVLTYKQDDFIKVYVNGVLTATASVAGGGRLWGHCHNADFTNSLSTFENYDYLRNSSVPQGALRRLNKFYAGGTGFASPTSYYVPGGFGGAFGMAALYGRVFEQAEIDQLYDSFVNPSTHTVLTGHSGYMAEVEADNPAVYLRLNDFTVTANATFTLGYTDCLALYEPSAVLGAQGFVSGSTALTTSAGGAYCWEVRLPSVFTVEFFCRPTSLTSSFLFIARQFNSIAPVYLQMSATGFLSLTLTDLAGTLTTYSLSHPALVVGTSYHIAISYDPWVDKQLKLYINGALVQTIVSGIIAATYYQNSFAIGGNISGTSTTLSSRFQGQIGEFAIYQYVLPAARVQAHYDARNS